MTSRDYVKNELDTLPDFLLDKVQEFIFFQKFNLRTHSQDTEVLRDIETASMSSMDFWDNPDDEVWNHV